MMFKFNTRFKKDLVIPILIFMHLVAIAIEIRNLMHLREAQTAQEIL